MLCTTFRITSNARAVESPAPLHVHPVCIMPAKADPEKASVNPQAARVFRITLIDILLGEKGVLNTGQQGGLSINQSSGRMIALGLAKDKALASTLAKALTPAP